MELEHEKFEGAKELAEIGMKISAGTAALASLKENEELYFAERERDLVFRLKQALLNSSDLLAAIGENHSALVGYKTELEDYHSKVLSLIEGVMECMKLIDDSTTELNAQMSAHEANVDLFREQSKRERTHIAGARTEVDAMRLQIDVDRRVVNDQRATLKRAFARLKDKK